MPRIAVTGHMNISSESVPLVRESIVTELSRYDGESIVGISCIARGADSMFAGAVLELGGTLEVVIPSQNYRQTKVKPDHAPQFDELVSRATKVHVLPYDEANRDAYEAANEVLLSSSDVLFAVWDSQQGVDKGSTASVVTAARKRGLRVIIIWPQGATRG